LSQSIYLFELKVTDNNGASSKDTMQVTVNAAANIPPVASAGTDKNITLPTNNVSLSGTGTDADGTISSYVWTKISGPSAVIANATSATTNVTSLLQGVYLFELKVIDNSGTSSKDTMQVTVNTAANIPPVANAGSDKIIMLPTNNVSLSGTGTDADGTISSYVWTKIGGPSATISNAHSATTNVKSLSKSVYLFELKVTDNSGTSSKDTMQVTVNAAANISPVANAGSDKIITLPTNNVSLNGTGTDADGTISSYVWTKISGPSATMANATSATTNVTSLLQGVYLFELKVTDNNGASAKDTMQVTVVNTAVNIPPVANAGSDITITLPVNIATLAGSGNDPDGTINNYKWIRLSGPALCNIVNASSPVTDVSGLVQGVYLFVLRVIDNNGEKGYDTLSVTVNAATVNIPPIANAGADQTIVLPVDSASLSGNGMDADGVIKSYSWKQIAGPSNANMVLPSSANTEVTNLMGGNYYFELSTTDNLGAVGKDTVTIAVAAPRITFQSSSRLKVYPNPVQDIATLEITTGKSNTSLLIMVNDMQGNTVYRQQIPGGQSTLFYKIDMGNLTGGIYVITVYFNAIENQSIRVLKN
ncbi:MAG: T9SS type A sorting domain-containing protein, partial [Ginsengibacter sp.]